MQHPTDSIVHTPAIVIPVVKHWLERDIPQWDHHEGQIGRYNDNNAFMMNHQVHCLYEALTPRLV